MGGAAIELVDDIVTFEREIAEAREEHEAATERLHEAKLRHARADGDLDRLEHRLEATQTALVILAKRDQLHPDVLTGMRAQVEASNARVAELMARGAE